jgi:hypothetical protein
MYAVILKFFFKIPVKIISQYREKLSLAAWHRGPPPEQKIQGLNPAKV